MTVRTVSFKSTEEIAGLRRQLEVWAEDPRGVPVHIRPNVANHGSYSEATEQPPPWVRQSRRGPRGAGITREQQAARDGVDVHNGQYPLDDCNHG